MRTYYQLLQVNSAARAEEIKSAFRVQIARYHPDKVSHLGEELQAVAAELATALNAAYQTLMNPEARAQYDRRLHHRSPSRPRPSERPQPGDQTARSGREKAPSARLYPSYLIRQALGRYQQCAGA